MLRQWQHADKCAGMRDTRRRRATDDRRDFNSASGRVQRARLKTLDDLDKRSRAYKHARRLVKDMESDLGGSENTTRAQRELVVRAAMLSALATDMEARYLRREEKIDVDTYCKLTNSLVRVINVLGLKRLARDVTTPSLDEYAQRRLPRGDAK